MITEQEFRHIAAFPKEFLDVPSVYVLEIVNCGIFLKKTSRECPR